MTTPRDLLTTAREKLARVVGAEEARKVLVETLRRTGLSQVESPNDLMRLANQLMQRGGVLEAVARSMKIQAILQGASEPPPRMEEPAEPELRDRPSTPTLV